MSLEEAEAEMEKKHTSHFSGAGRLTQAIAKAEGLLRAQQHFVSNQHLCSLLQTGCLGLHFQGTITTHLQAMMFDASCRKVSCLSCCNKQDHGACNALHNATQGVLAAQHSLQNSDERSQCVLRSLLPN